MQSIEEFHLQAAPYIRTFNAFAHQHKLNGIAEVDHICFKCDSSHTFEKIRALFETETASQFIYQSFIARRRIACIQMEQGILTDLGIIHLLELSDKKPDKEQVSTFDHIEICPTSITYDQLVEHLRKGGVKLEEEIRPHHTTHDAPLAGNFKIRLTKEPLMQKIARDEMKLRLLAR